MFVRLRIPIFWPKLILKISKNDHIEVVGPNFLNALYTQYREQGVFLSRGVPIEELAKQVFARAGSHADGKQMPVHYGSKKCKYYNIQKRKKM